MTQVFIRLEPSGIKRESTQRKRKSVGKCETMKVIQQQRKFINEILFHRPTANSPHESSTKNKQATNDLFLLVLFAEVAET